MNIISVLIIGLILGVKHSLEPDHIIAVSTIVSKTNKISKSILIGMYWGIGHTITLFIVGMIFIIFKLSISNVISMSLELVVGIMIIYLGIKNLFYNNSSNSKNNMYSNVKLTSIRSIIIGSIHGLSGSAALIILTMTTVNSILEASVYILVFGIGTVLGMQMFTSIIGVPFIMSYNNKKLNKNIIMATSIISIVFGGYYIYDILLIENLLSYLK